ncbi:MAG: hypothetical protein ACJ789_20290 [Thermomicrobiales bacterium]
MVESTRVQRRRNDGRTAFFVILICLLLIGGLRVASSGEASSKDQGTSAIPVPKLSSSKACASWAHYWMTDSGVDASQQAIEGMSNCRMAADGTWFVPTSSTDLRLPNGPALTAAETVQTAALRNAIESQLGNLQRQFPKSLQTKIATIYDASDHGVVGRVKVNQPLSDVRGRYTRLAQAFLIDPANAQLADYVGWEMANRQASFTDFRQACQQDDLQYLWVACDGIAGALSIYFPPWPWDLMRSVNLDAYLKWALYNGKVEVVPTPASIRLPRS